MVRERIMGMDHRIDPLTVTPEMLEAGVDAWCGLCEQDWEDNYRQCVAEIVFAAVAARDEKTLSSETKKISKMILTYGPIMDRLAVANLTAALKPRNTQNGTQD